MTAPWSVLSPSNILPPPSLHSAITAARKNSVRVSKMLLSRELTLVTLRHFNSVLKHTFHRQIFCLQHSIICAYFRRLFIRKLQTLTDQDFLYGLYETNQAGSQENARKTTRKYDDTSVSRHQYLLTYLLSYSMEQSPS